MEDHSADMTKKTAKNVVKTIFQSPSPVIKIEFQGGDPSTYFNMVKYIIEDMELIHSVDSIKLASEIDRHAARVNKVQDILIEVNVGGEESKSGIAPDQLEELLRQAGQLSHVHVRGLMTIPPVEGDEKFLYKMQQLYLDISSKKMDNIDMDILSMGMSGDFKEAIAAGSTLVRIGSAIFGDRQY